MMKATNHKRLGAIAVLAAIAMLGVQAASAAPMQLSDGDKITLDWGTGTYGHGSGGGEFMARGVGALSGFDSFVTFCLEYTEHISLAPHSYFVDINTKAIAGGGVLHTYAGDVDGTAGVEDPLSPATAWLYTQFRTNHLQDFVTFSYTSDADANSLQAAMWVLENEKSTSFLGSSTSTASKLFNAAVAAGWTDIHNVRVLNLYENYDPATHVFSGGRQDQLYITPIPEPGTYGMLLAGLGLMGFVAGRRTKGGADNRP